MTREGLVNRSSLALIAAAGVMLALQLDAAAQDATQEKTYVSKPAPEGARVYIIWPHDGQTIPGGKFWLRMGLSGAGVAPAGIDKPNTGHHHVLVDAPLPAMNQPIPNDKNHLHFGAGQTEARIELPPGRHTLQLLLGDTEHVPQTPPLYSKQIAVIVPAQ
jgi:hypothetical protein